MSDEKQPMATGRGRTAKKFQRLESKHRLLRGPIPIDWLLAAARLPGRSLHVAIALRVYGDREKSLVVPLSNISGKRFGLDRNAKYRGLAWLEAARLVSVRRRLGCSPIVTILDSGGSHEREP
jgi:hypothetical protein